MKKRTTTIVEPSIHDDYDDEKARQWVADKLMCDPEMVSVVSEPIPEPIVLKVLGLVANPRAVRDVCEAALMDNYRTRSFHVEVIPQ